LEISLGENSKLKKDLETALKERDQLTQENSKLKQDLETALKEKDPLNQQNHSSNPLCNNGHNLEFYTQDARNYRSLNFICNRCRNKKFQDSWHCSACKYDLCSACQPFVYHKNKCLNGHILSKSLSTDAYCDKCKDDVGSCSLVCNACNFDLCKTCNDNLPY